MNCALAAETLRADKAEAALAAVNAPMKWEDDHQRRALEDHGLMSLYFGCDSIDRVCESLIGARAEVERLRDLNSRHHAARAEVEEQARDLHRAHDVGLEQAAEIERLKRELAVMQHAARALTRERDEALAAVAKWEHLVERERPSMRAREPRITVNGHVLTVAQAVTMRVALEGFAMSLDSEGLGDDPHGVEMSRAYLERIAEIRQVMY